MSEGKERTSGWVTRRKPDGTEERFNKHDKKVVDPKGAPKEKATTNKIAKKKPRRK